MSALTLHEAIAAAAARLEGGAGVSEDAARDAQLLLLHTLRLQRTSLFTEAERRLTQPEQERFDVAVERRALGEPIQYITGEQEFYGLAMKVSRAVLIPRPETELLVEAVLARLPREGALRILDVGTGSGAIAVTLAKLLSEADVTAVDLSPKALAVAKQNAEAHGVAARMRFLESDLLAAVKGEQFDAVVSNPPYIPDADRASLHRQVREFEPEMALFAGATGLDVYERLVPEAWAALKPGGLLAMEIGYGQRGALAALMSAWDGVQFLDDLQGIARVVVGWKAAR